MFDFIRFILEKIILKNYNKTIIKKHINFILLLNILICGLKY